MPETDFLKRYKASSPEIRDFINSEKLIKLLQSIAALTNLTSEQTEKLTDIITDILVRKTPLNEFSDLLISSLKISVPQAKVITQVANQKIFAPFKKELRISPPQPNAQSKLVSYPKIKTQKISSFSVLQKKTEITPIKTRERKSTIPFPAAVPKPIATEKKKTNIPPLKKESLPHLPEPAEVVVKKPEIKTTGLKNFSVSPEYREQAEKIQNKLLAAMRRRMAPPKIVETIKQLSKAGWKNLKQAPPEKKSKPIKLNTNAPSRVFSGEKGKFTSSKPKNISRKKPFILNVKLKKEEKEEKLPKEQKTISYSKYKPKNPFGKA